MGGRCRYSCFLVYRGLTSFIAADFDSILANRPRCNSDPKIIRSLIKSDAKTFYAYVGSKSKVKSKIGPLKDDNGKVTSSEQEMAHELNKFS